MQWVPTGPRGTRATLKLMRDLVEQSWMDPRVLEGAAWIVPRDHDRERPAPYGRAIDRWIRAHVTIIDEPFERIMAPGRMLEQVAATGRALGDCDDVATLAASLLTVAGIETDLVAIKEPGAPAFQHVYVEFDGGDRWEILDPTVDEFPDREFDRMMESVLSYG